MWNQRYNSVTYAYGTEPNDFLVAMFDKVHGGEFHNGVGAVVQALAWKP